LCLRTCAFAGTVCLIFDYRGFNLPYFLILEEVYCNHQLFAPFTIEGACNRDVFETWLETCLLPTLQPGQKVVLDNASFHKGGRIEALVQQAGCEVWYLPVYSPDLNKIEHCWSWLKSRIRKQLDKFESLRDAMEHVLKEAAS
jgi:transposase